MDARMNQPFIPPDHFDRLYASNPDPWAFATSGYERDKYAATLAALPRPRFARCFEVGCSIGVLTRDLAGRCDEVLAVDVADAALDQARARCADLSGVTCANMVLPGAWPDGQFDLVIFSEVLYYLGIPGLQQAARQTVDCLLPGGTVVLVNWRGPTDGACTGEEAADLFTAAAPSLRTTHLARAEKYRLDVLQLG